jgi:hypothetical protein
VLAGLSDLWTGVRGREEDGSPVEEGEEVLAGLSDLWTGVLESVKSEH